MNKKLFFTLLVTFFSVSAMCSCNGNEPSSPVSKTETLSKDASCQVEVIYFHGKQRCKTCMAIERQTQALMDGELAKQVKSGRVKFTIADISTAEGKALAQKYKVSFSSLMVVSNPGPDETVVDFTKAAFANALNNPELFRKELKETILGL